MCATVTTAADEALIGEDKGLPKLSCIIRATMLSPFGVCIKAVAAFAFVVAPNPDAAAEADAPLAPLVSIGVSPCGFLRWL